MRRTSPWSIRFSFLVRSALFALVAIGVSHAARATVFVVDASQSQISVEGTVLGVPFVEQAPGSLSTRIGGTLVADLGPGSIQSPGGSKLTLENQPGLFLPLGLPANGAGQVQFDDGSFAYGALRNTVADVLSGVLPVDSAGFFPANVTLNFPSGVLDVEGLGMSNSIPNPSGLQSNPATLGQIIFDGSKITITAPIDANTTIYGFFGGEIAKLHYTGQIVATAIVPEPSSWCLAMLGLISLAVVGRHARLQRASHR
jgi:hypothetical protein